MKGALLDYIRAKVGQAIKSASTIIYTNPPSLTTLPGDGLVTKNMLVGYVPPNTRIPVVKSLTTTDADIYTLTSPELATINNYDTYPNFVAIVTASGQQFFDIYPLYTGVLGAFTQIQVVLHSDSAGHNAENTIIQFS